MIVDDDTIVIPYFFQARPIGVCHYVPVVHSEEFVMRMKQPSRIVIRHRDSFFKLILTALSLALTSFFVFFLRIKLL